jgi:hypothetical protein
MLWGATFSFWRWRRRLQNGALSPRALGILDLKELKPEYQVMLNLEDISDLLLRVNDPCLLFGFSEIAHLFVTQICAIRCFVEILLFFTHKQDLMLLIFLKRMSIYFNDLLVIYYQCVKMFFTHQRRTFLSSLLNCTFSTRVRFCLYRRDLSDHLAV